MKLQSESLNTSNDWQSLVYWGKIALVSCRKESLGRLMFPNLWNALAMSALRRFMVQCEWIWRAKQLVLCTWLPHPDMLQGFYHEVTPGWCPGLNLLPFILWKVLGALLEHISSLPFRWGQLSSCTSGMTSGVFSGESRRLALKWISWMEHKYYYRQIQRIVMNHNQ